MKSLSRKKPVRIALIQMFCGKSPKDNLEKAVTRIQSTARKGAKIICLQELFRTPYFCQTEDKKNFSLAESIPGPTTDILSRVAKTHKITLIAPVFEKVNNTYFNSAVVINQDGKIQSKYRKMHIPEDPGFHEKFYFKPGDLGFRVIQTPYAKIAVFICWDQWFPEAARVAALEGAEIIFYPTAIGWKLERRKELEEYRSAWECIQRSHAIANGVFVASVNRVGRESALSFWGSSFVADPFGKILKRGSSFKEENLVVDCDLNLINKTRHEWPFFRDRSIKNYKTITELCQPR